MCHLVFALLTAWKKGARSQSGRGEEVLQRTEALACTHSETHQAPEPVYDMSQIEVTSLINPASEQVHRGSTTGGEAGEEQVQY